MKKITAFLFSSDFVFQALASKALHRVVRIILFLIIFSNFSSYAVAGIREKQDISKTVQRSDIIIRGKVISTESQWKEDNRGRHIYTSVTVKILDKIKGNVKDDIFAFEVVGGTVDDIREVVSDTPAFEIDEDAIMFLAGYPLTIKQEINGKIPIYDDRIYWEDSEVTVDSFIEAIKILEQDPNSPVFLVEEDQEPTAGVTAAECFIYDDYKWFGTSPTVSYKINQNTSDCTGEGTAVQAAATEWNNVGANFTFQYGDSHTNTVSSQNYINEIFWGGTSLPTTTVARTYWWHYESTGKIIECDIEFNNYDYYWTTTAPYSGKMDVQTVALHEFGHWLLLDDLYNSDDSSNVMYGYIGTGQVKRALQPCDISGICYIYGGCVTSYTLSVNSSGASGVSISSSTGHGGTTNYTKTVSSGTSVTLTAPSSSGGQTFTGWTGDVTSSNQTISFSMNGTKTVTANYVQIDPNIITIGIGTLTWNYPLATYYHDARTQTIYLASEIGGAYTFNSLALNVNMIPGQVMTNFTIRLKQTSLAAYGASPVWESTGWTTVYQSNQTISATDWTMFTFSTPFEYNGTQNLMIDISFNNSSYTVDGLCLYTSLGTNRSIFYRTDSDYGDPLTWANQSPTPNVNTYFPNIRLGFAVVTTVSTPVFIPAGGSYSSKQNVTITCDTPGATICYTTDGNDPTESDPVIASGSSVLVGHTLMLKAKAWKTGIEPSGIKTADYQIELPCPEADLTGDCVVNFKDFASLANWWLYYCDASNDWCEASDFDLSGDTGIKDVAVLTDQWLDED